ncbi:uncharacterized protein DUF1573 [Mucilaginibacter gracilis]|uniref:Uncharacterized protein DUF1573 n=1 Tax=Mucilaginibacter gracilis TaxID=423350 RepID=A0A495J6Z5_9SPHI|nr:DUF1573 domain-containing protein [Mucilaginibacter gracilis]RKR84766.1 uncharacterized protein DUF1573 [Mucilaginibacter gracilis]
MKKIFLALITAGMLAACNNTSKQTTATNADSVAGKPTAAQIAMAPVITFESDSYDFGKIKEGDKVSHNFKFTNSGKSPLIISSAVASCGCTTPEWPKEPVKPGDSGVIKVTFNSAGKGGLQDKLITITANTIPAQNLAHLKGEVEVTKTK